MRTGFRRRLRQLLDQRGTLLLEVVIAMFLLSLSVLPIFLSATALLTSTGESLCLAMATGLLQERAEELKAQGYDSLGLPTVDPVVTENYKDSVFDVTKRVYEITTMTSETGGTGLVKRVVLRIYRHPYSPTAKPISYMDFLVYAENGF